MKRTDGNPRPSRHRDLTREEVELWRQVTRTIAPFEGRKVQEIQPKAPTSSSADSETAAPKGRAGWILPGYTPPPQRPDSGLMPLNPLERRLRQRLSRGRIGVDAVMDLHGMRQGEAHSALRHFIHSAQARGAKVVLVITGKGRTSASASDTMSETGVLRRSVPQWLRAPDLRGLIVGFEEASHTHGGAGALYIRIRRAGHSAGDRS